VGHSVRNLRRGCIRREVDQHLEERVAGSGFPKRNSAYQRRWKEKIETAIPWGHADYNCRLEKVRRRFQKGKGKIVFFTRGGKAVR